MLLPHLARLPGDAEILANIFSWDGQNEPIDECHNSSTPAKAQFLSSSPRTRVQEKQHRCRYKRASSRIPSVDRPGKNHFPGKQQQSRHESGDGVMLAVVDGPLPAEGSLHLRRALLGIGVVGIAEFLAQVGFLAAKGLLGDKSCGCKPLLTGAHDVRPTPASVPVRPSVNFGSASRFGLDTFYASDQSEGEGASRRTVWQLHVGGVNTAITFVLPEYSTGSALFICPVDNGGCLMLTGVSRRITRFKCLALAIAFVAGNAAMAHAATITVLTDSSWLAKGALPGAQAGIRTQGSIPLLISGWQGAVVYQPELRRSACMTASGTMGLNSPRPRTPIYGRRLFSTVPPSRVRWLAA